MPGRFLLLVPILLGLAGAVGVPLLLLADGALAPQRPGGLGRPVSEILALVLRSGWLALGPAVLASALAFLAGVLAVFTPWFRRCYRAALRALLFTNPVFLVIGAGVLLTALSPSLAVVLTSTYLLLPVVGTIVLAAAERHPAEVLRAARSLGASPACIARTHLLPYLVPQLLLSTLLGFALALGFYLLPVLVGLGRVVTLGSAIDSAANRVGDGAAACQLGLLSLALTGVILLAGVLLLHALRRIGAAR